MPMRVIKLSLLLLCVAGTVSVTEAREAQSLKSSWTKIKEIFK